MMDLRELIRTELQWVRRGYWPAAFALRWNEFDVGTLAWENIFLSRAIVRTAAGAWRIRRQGFRTFAIEALETGAPVATLTTRLLAADLQFADGRKLEMRRVTLFPPVSVFRNEAGSELVTLRGRWALLWRGGSCRLEPASAELPEAALVALVGSYVLLRRARRRARRSAGRTPETPAPCR